MRAIIKKITQLTETPRIHKDTEFWLIWSHVNRQAQLEIGEMSVPLKIKLCNFAPGLTVKLV